MKRQNRYDEEYETLLKKKEKPVLPPPEIPSRAKQSIALAFAIIFVGIICIYLFVATFFSNTCISKTEGRWAYFIFAILTIPSGSYTLFIAYQVYHRNPNYSWPMIF